jgi:hypothetical protein
MTLMVSRNNAERQRAATKRAAGGDFLTAAEEFARSVRDLRESQLMKRKNHVAEHKAFVSGSSAASRSATVSEAVPSASAGTADRCSRM